MSHAGGRLRVWAERLRTSLDTLWLAAWHPETPRVVRWLALALIVYAVSPIDLIPDFIPILGQLDDLLLLPLGIALVIRLIPERIWLECKMRAVEQDYRERVGPWGLLLVSAIWLIAVLGLYWGVS